MSVEEDGRKGEFTDVLGPRELETLRLTSLGHLYYEVARAMGVSPQTVKNCLTVVRRKLDAHTTAWLSD